MKASRPSSAPSMAIPPSAIISTGTASAAEISVSSQRPSRPADQPAARPISVPMSSRTKATTATICIVGRTAHITRLSRSRPNWSEPNGNPGTLKAGKGGVIQVSPALIMTFSARGSPGATCGPTRAISTTNSTIARPIHSAQLTARHGRLAQPCRATERAVG